MKLEITDAESKTNVFIIIRLKDFYDNLNIVVALAPGIEFLSSKCAQFPLTLIE